MKKSIFVFMTILLSLFITSKQALADGAEVTRDGFHIYYKTNFMHMNAEQQKDVIMQSVDALKQDLSVFLESSKGPTTLESLMPSSSKLDDLVSKAMQSVDDSYVGKKDFLPAGFMWIVGGSWTLDIGIGGGGACDIGLVMVPTMVTRVNTKTKNVITYYEQSWALVAIPHLHAGVGAGAGASLTVAGIGFIFGEHLTNANEFVGAIGSGAIDVQVLAGLDIRLSGVLSGHHHYGLLTFEADAGAEAQATANIEGGAILPLWDEFQGSTVSLAGKTVSASAAENLTRQ